jgi:hypothetical protein
VFGERTLQVVYVKEYTIIKNNNKMTDMLFILSQEYPWVRWVMIGMAITCIILILILWIMQKEELKN